MDAKLTRAQLAEIFHKLPPGERADRRTTKRVIKWLGMTLLADQIEIGPLFNCRYQIAREIRGAIAWIVVWDDCNNSTLPDVQLTTNDYEMYLADMSIIRMI
jgi:hypothetical protein